MWEVILTKIAIGVAVSVLGVIGKAVIDWSSREKVKAATDKAHIARADAIEALAAAVNTIGGTIVSDLKDKASDGKLTKAEIKSVQHKAITEAKKVATNPDAIDFLINTTFDIVSRIITSIVQGKK